MRRRAALALVALGLVAGAGTGAGIRAELTSPAAAPPLPGPTSVAPTATRPTPSGTPTAEGTPTLAGSRPLGRDDLVSVAELEAAGWRDGSTTPTVTSDEVDPVVTPCQRPGPFTGLAGVVVGRWQGPAGRAGEVVAEATSVDDARRRANDLYQQHLRCTELEGRSVGARHAITVDGGSITWFEVAQGGRTGLSAVVRQSDRFAVVYADEAQIPIGRLPGLLRDAADELR